MESNNSSVFVCGRCGHYNAQGRRGGHCQKLDGMVRGWWKACPLAISIFAWKKDPRGCTSR